MEFTDNGQCLDAPRGVELLQRETAFKGFLTLVRYRLRVPILGQGRSAEQTLECVGHQGAAVVLPYDPRRDLIVLIEQFRVGALEDASGGYLLEPPGGLIEAARDAEWTARQEAGEEAGCVLGRLLRIGRCHTSPGFSAETVELFCGEVDTAALPRFAGLNGEGESTRIWVKPLDDVLSALGQPGLSSATTMLTVQWLALHRARVRAVWTVPASSHGAGD